MRFIEPALILALLTLQFLVGFRIIHLPFKWFRHVHRAVAASLGGLFLLHGFGPLIRFVNPMATMQPLVMPFGLLLIGLLGMQVLIGFRIIRIPKMFRGVHIAMASVIVAIGVTHGAAITVGATHPPSPRCESCHRPPLYNSAHKWQSNCRECHDEPGRSWSYSHTRANDCERCHQPPQRNHKWTSKCVECHDHPGRSWFYSHTSAADCQRCHQPPARHFPPPCVQCHERAGIDWAFEHPLVSGGEHTYTDFPCAKCHPRTYAKAYCTCHPRGVAPQGD